MQHRPTRLVLPLVASTLCLAAATDSQACAMEPFVGSVCIMAIPWTNLYGYSPADGSMLTVASNQVLFSLIGNTYGGDGRVNFQLPDLRGRVVLGAGAKAGQPTYLPGATGGTASVTLLPVNVPVPPHTHGLVTGPVLTVGLGTLAATTTLTGLNATTSLAGVTAKASASGLNLKGYSGGAGSSSAGGGALATPASPTNKIYAGSAPDVTMAAGSITGDAPVTFTGNPTTMVTGTPTTTLAGAPSVTLAGTTEPNQLVPATQPVATMPPYLAMNYFIALQGVYPQRN